MNPQTQDAQASITQWTQDVNTVNSFLNTVSGIIGDSATLGSAAQTALNSATDEPCQLMTLSSAPDLMDVPAFTCAVQDLMEVFDTHVLMPLTKILVNPSETTTAQAAVDEINFFRCCNVLPDVSELSPKLSCLQLTVYAPTGRCPLRQHHRRSSPHWLGL